MNLYRCRIAENNEILGLVRCTTPANQKISTLTVKSKPVQSSTTTECSIVEDVYLETAVVPIWQFREFILQQNRLHSPS